MPDNNIPEGASGLGTHHQLSLGPEFSGMRLDKVLPILFPGVSRSSLVRLVKSGLVSLDSVPAKPSQQVRPGQTLSLFLPQPKREKLVPAPQVAFGVILEDPDFLVVDKPARLAVHPADGVKGPTLVEALLARYPELSVVGDPSRPGVVHRLDMDTTGALLIARNEIARERLSAAFAARSVRKRYLAFVVGKPKKTAQIELPVGRHPRLRHKMAAGTPSGREARTSYRLLRHYPGVGLALLSVNLHTGRTHQARVHLASQGLPILGDRLYGGDQRAILAASPGLAPLVQRQFLHARRLSFPLPGRAGRLSVAAPWPDDFLRLLRFLEGQEGDVIGTGPKA